MRSRLRLADEVVHPLLLMFPLGLFALAFVFDVAGPLGAPQLIGTVGQCTIVAGLAGGTAAVSVVWFDAVSAPRGSAARAGVLGVLLDLGVLVLYAVIALVRLQHSGRTAAPGLVWVEALGLTATVFSAWLAGRLGGRRRPKPIRSG